MSDRSINLVRAPIAMAVIVVVGVGFAWTVSRWPDVFVALNGAPGLLGVLLLVALGVWLDRWAHR